jgi:tryptophan synthase alpha chain
MNLLRAFETVRRKNEAALLAYHVAGYPTLSDSMRVFRTLAEGGADILEVGVPFSDPIADGPAIQSASACALRRGATLRAIVQGFAGSGIHAPCVLMSYINPLLAYGIPRLFGDLKQAGFCGLIVPDLPPEEASGWIQQSERHGLDMVFLVTPVSGPGRIRFITSRSRGFIYAVSVTGTTGARNSLPGDLSAFLARVRRFSDLPVAVGFGISTPDQVRAVSRSADGAVVGSRIVEAVRRGEDVRRLVANLKRATRAKS